MTAAAATQVLAIPGGIVADVDLWCPDQQDPIGRDPGWHPGGVDISRPDPLRYVVWVDTGRWHRNSRDFHRQTRSLPELAPRRALHVNHGRAER